MEGVNENYSFCVETKLIALEQIECLEMKTTFNISDPFWNVRIYLDLYCFAIL